MIIFGKRDAHMEFELSLIIVLKHIGKVVLCSSVYV